jgi:O-antigen/teichoic acid export membrane protein
MRTDTLTTVRKALSFLADLIVRPQAHSLKLQSIRAALWTVLEKGTGHLIRMAGSLILTRILFPEAFGLMAAAQVILVMIQLVTDVGIRISIIQNPKGTQEEFLDTAWVISVVRGALLSLALAAMAYPLSLYYGQPEMTGIFLVLSLSPLLMGMENPALTLTIRKFRVEKKVALELGSQALGLVSSIALALILRSVYALAIGNVLAVLYRLAGSFIAVPYRPKVRFHRAFGREILRFGSFIFVNSLIYFLAMNADILMIGKVLPMKDLGIYSIGRNIGMLIWMVCHQIFLQSYLPAVSSAQHDIPRVARMYGRSIALMLALTIPASMMLALFSRDVIALLYDPRYADAYISLFWFSLGGIMLVVAAINSNTFLALGKPKYETISMACGFLTVCLLVPLGARHYGLTGAAAGVFVSVLVIVAVETVCLFSAIRFPLSRVLAPWSRIVLTCSAISCLYILLHPALNGLGPWNLPFIAVMLVLTFAASGCTWLIREKAGYPAEVPER